MATNDEFPACFSLLIVIPVHYGAMSGSDCGIGRKREDIVSALRLSRVTMSLAGVMLY